MSRRKFNFINYITLHTSTWYAYSKVGKMLPNNTLQSCCKEFMLLSFVDFKFLFLILQGHDRHPKQEKKLILWWCGLALSEL